MANFFAVAQLAWRNLFRNTRRTLASLITVALGAAALLIFQGYNTGIISSYRENTIHGYYGFGQVFPKGYYGKVLEKPWTAWIQNSDEVEKQLLASPGVVDVFPRVSFYSFIVKGGMTLGGHGEGILPERENKFFNHMNFIDGGEIQNIDDIVIGKGLANSLGVKAGDTVTLLIQTVNGQLNGADLHVAGIFHLGKKIIDDSFFRVHLQQAQKLLDTKGVELYSIATKGVEYWDEAARGMTARNPNIEPVRFEILDKVYYQNSIDFLAAQFNFIRSIILVIIGLGIFNTISVSLLERSGEVGALRANGEKRARLFVILLIENSLLGLFGSLLGVLIAVSIDQAFLARGIPMPPAPGVTRAYDIYVEFLPKHYAQALFLPLVATILASLWPIRTLLRKSIPELLRST